MQQIKTYISAKLGHASMLAALQPDGFHINARWIEMADAGRKRMKPISHWQQENFDDIVAAHVFILYVEPSDQLKGSIFEAGYAVAHGKKIWIVGNGDKAGEGWGVDCPIEGSEKMIRLPHKDIPSWGLYRPAIKCIPSLSGAFLNIKTLVNQDRILNAKGDELTRPSF